MKPRVQQFPRLWRQHRRFRENVKPLLDDPSTMISCHPTCMTLMQEERPPEIACSFGFHDGT